MDLSGEFKAKQTTQDLTVKRQKERGENAVITLNSYTFHKKCY